MSSGKILVVSANSNFVVISLGRRDGVEKGMEFSIFRDEQFVARVSVERVEDEWSVTKVSAGEKTGLKVDDLVKPQ